MTMYDISVPLSSAIPTYPGDPEIAITSWLELAHGDPANVSLLHFGAHSGTHIDAPAHFLAGAAKVDAVSLGSLIGEVDVIEVPRDTIAIDEQFILQHCKSHSQRILFKTRNSDFWNNPGTGFRNDYSYLEPAAARRLVELGIRLVGIDYLSIEKFGGEDFETHRVLLSHDVVILEGLDLRQVSAGHYELICLPLRIAEGTGDGAPARAVLRAL